MYGRPSIVGLTRYTRVDEEKLQAAAGRAPTRARKNTNADVEIESVET